MDYLWRLSLHMQQHYFILFLIALLPSMTNAQSEQDREYYEEYNNRIIQSRIDGVYIPKDLDDAFSELIRLSEKEAIDKFTAAPEEIIATKLKGGLGRWMLINWGFHEGSRLSHHIRTLGIQHPEDMAQFLLVSFHRYLNKKPLDVEGQAAIYQQYRQEELQSMIQRDTFKIKQ